MPTPRPGLAPLTIVAALAGLLAAGPAQADLPRTYQVQRIENPTPGTNERFGDGLVNGGDVNGDGEEDILVGIDEHATITGEVFVFSGADGSLIRRIPAPDPDAGGAGDNPDAFGTYVGKIADIVSCPGAAGRGDNPGEDCTATQSAMDTGDAVPDHLASAVGVDIVEGDDMGVVYVLDGATGTVVKRIRMPAADRAEQAENSPTASQGGAFGRTVLSPSGQPPCEGFGGVAFDIAGVDQNPCDYPAGSFVARGDVDGGGKPDIGVGASDFTDGTAGADPAANPNCTTTICFQTGRYFVYRGEDLAGLSPSTPLETTLYTIKNPAVQGDLATINSRFHREAMGYSVAPVGDLGSCTSNTTPIAPGDDPDSYYCLNSPANSTAPDGNPEIVVSSHRVDASGLGDVGLAFVIDGPTGRVLDVLNHPQPQQTAIFAFSNYNQPALGDAGSNVTPDIYQGAMTHDVQFRAQGRGWVLNGDFRFGGANHFEIAQLDDPTPNKIGNFGTSSAGVGNVDGDSRKELAIGAYGPHAPQIVEDVISDVHIFSPLTEEVLQTIPDPDQQPGAGFGRALAPMGDLNDDGFLDFAVGAGGFDPGAAVTCSPCTGPPNPGQGRIYLLRSDNSPAPTGPPAPPAPPAADGASSAVVLAGRSVSLAASRTRVRARSRRSTAAQRRRRVRLLGVVEAFSNASACVPRQRVAIQRRRPSRARYRTFARRTTRRSGAFSIRIRPRRTFVYRARVDQTANCHGAVSETERITVLRRKRSAGRRR